MSQAPAPDDAAFWAAFRLLDSPDDPVSSDAWARAFTWCFDHSDRLAYCIVLARFSELVASGQTPPPGALKALALAFDTFRSGSTFDEAFGMSRPRAGQPRTIGDRERDRTIAGLVQFFRDNGETSIARAAARVADNLTFGHGLSAEHIERIYKDQSKGKSSNSE